jgi:hypothetical protein
MLLQDSNKIILFSHKIDILICSNYINIYKYNLIYMIYHEKFRKNWGLGIGDWGLGIGDWAQSPIPNPHINFNIFFKINSVYIVKL